MLAEIPNGVRYPIQLRGYAGGSNGGNSPITEIHGTLVDPTRIMTSLPLHNPTSVRSVYPPEMFTLMTDILADLVLADIKEYPQLPRRPRIDRLGRGENTVLLQQEDGT